MTATSTHKAHDMTQPSRTGGQILVDALKIHGVDIAFGVPGESYLDVLDALHDSDIRFIINRQEGGAAFMADAYGKMTGKPPHGYFAWNEGTPVANMFRFLFLGEGDVAPLVHEVLRRAIPNPEERPIIHVS